MTYQPKDRFFHKAKQEGFAARSVYKLQEIDQKFKIFRSGQVVLDLGASPGSWSQFVSQRVGQTGRILGLDLKECTVKLENATFVLADLRDTQLDEVITQNGFPLVFDVVLSDMMANTTGIRSTDQARSLELCELALQSAQRFLRPGGSFVCKFFQSGEFGKLRADIKKQFARVEALKPESTRSISKEIFLVGLGKK